MNWSLTLCDADHTFRTGWLNTSIQQASLWDSVLGSQQKWIGLWSSLSTALCPIRHLIGHHILLMIIIFIIPIISLRQNCSKDKLFSSLKQPIDPFFSQCCPSGGQCPKLSDTHSHWSIEDQWQLKGASLVVLQYAKLLQSRWTLCNPPDCSPPGFPVHGIHQARILEWVAISFSRGSSQPRDWTCVSFVSYIGRWVLYH